KVAEARGTVTVRPEVVVEVAYNDVQRSPQYECGMTLRFARIVRIRDDKSATEADTIETLTSEFERQLVNLSRTKSSGDDSDDSARAHRPTPSRSPRSRSSRSPRT